MLSVRRSLQNLCLSLNKHFCQKCEPAPVDLEPRKIWVFQLMAFVVSPSTLVSPFSVGNLCGLKLKECHGITLRSMDLQEITAKHFCAVSEGLCLLHAQSRVTCSLCFPRSVGDRLLCRTGSRAGV